MHIGEYARYAFHRISSARFYGGAFYEHRQRIIKTTTTTIINVYEHQQSINYMLSTMFMTYRDRQTSRSGNSAIRNVPCIVEVDRDVTPHRYRDVKLLFSCQKASSLLFGINSSSSLCSVKTLL